MTLAMTFPKLSRIVDKYFKNELLLQLNEQFTIVCFSLVHGQFEKAYICNTGVTTKTATATNSVLLYDLGGIH